MWTPFHHSTTKYWYTSQGNSVEINVTVHNEYVQSLYIRTIYFPFGENIHSWFVCLKTSEKFILLACYSNLCALNRRGKIQFHHENINTTINSKGPPLQLGSQASSVGRMLLRYRWLAGLSVQSNKEDVFVPQRSKIIRWISTYFRNFRIYRHMW